MSRTDSRVAFREDPHSSSEYYHFAYQKGVAEVVLNGHFSQ
jgi:hypothetical protein